jgi:putative transposase
MSNHVHLLVELRKPTLSTGMQYLNSAYARAFNKRHGYSGHAFEARFHSSLVASERHLAATLRYIALNPVAAGLCMDPAQWRWSSYRATAGLETPPAFLATDRVRALFGAAHRAADEYVHFVHTGLPQPLPL